MNLIEIRQKISCNSSPQIITFTQSSTQVLRSVKTNLWHRPNLVINLAGRIGKEATTFH
jgi:hypothetical protein